MRLLIKKDCVDMEILRPALLDYFERSPPDLMIGQTAAIHFALVPLLYDKTGILFNLTIGWLVRKGKPIYQHDERQIQRFIEGNIDAWLDEGCPFHLWLTSPACEILDVTFAMNLGWAETKRNALISTSTNPHTNLQAIRFITRCWSGPISFTRPAGYCESAVYRSSPIGCLLDCALLSGAYDA